MPEGRKHRGLTDEERAASLARLEEFERRYAEIPDEERTPIENPEKYAGPIGADGEGHIRTYRRAEDLPEDCPALHRWRGQRWGAQRSLTV